MDTSRTQRWRDRRAHFIPGATTIDPRDYAVDIISSERAAAPFLAAHHYLGTLPAARLSCGLFRNGPGGTSQLVGVATFSQPVNNASIRLRTGLTDHLAATDLGRLVLLNDVPGNGETWFLARAFQLVLQEKPGIETIIAYSDPVARPGVDGRPTLPGHCGIAYQAMSATYTGRTKARRRLILPNGQVLSDRTAAKIASESESSGLAEQQIILAGCIPRLPFESGSSWLNRLKNDKLISSEYHPGCHAYSFALTRRGRKALRAVASQPRPKRDFTRTDGDVTALPLLAI